MKLKYWKIKYGAKTSQSNQTNLMTQQIEIQREMQSDIQQLFHSYEGKKAGGQMVISN